MKIALLLLTSMKVLMMIMWENEGEEEKGMETLFVK